MSDQGALVSAHLSRYDALLRISRTLAQHRTITELFDVLRRNYIRVFPSTNVGKHRQRAIRRFSKLEPLVASSIGRGRGQTVCLAAGKSLMWGNLQQIAALRIAA